MKEFFVSFLLIRFKVEVYKLSIDIIIISVTQFVEFRFIIVKRSSSRQDGKKRILGFPIYFIKAQRFVDIVNAHK